MTSARRLILPALAAAAVFCLWAFHQPLLKGGVADFNGGLPAPAQAVRFGAEGRYMVHASYATLNRLVRAGHFPLWTPHAGGGTPLLGKMLPGALTPLNIPYYLSGAAGLPYMFVLVAALKFLLAIVFTYLLGRVLGLDVVGAVLAGLTFTGGNWYYNFTFYGIPSSALFLPLLLLLGELYLRGRRRPALLLLPWAVGLPFYGAHFETAALANISAAVYFAARVRLRPKRGGKRELRPLLEYAAAAVVGAVIAAPSLLAVSEYVVHSYTRVWRSQQGFGWHYHTIAKHLTGADAVMGLLGWAALFGGGWCMRKFYSAEAPLAQRAPWPWAAAALWAVAFGALANLGLDLSLRNLVTHGAVPSLWVWALNIGLLAAALWGWARTRSLPLRILGALMILAAAIRLKLPPLTNLMVELPIFDRFNNADYHFVYDLAGGLLLGAALQELKALGGDPGRRRAALLGAAAFWWPLIAAYAGAPYAERLLARHVATSVHPQSRGADMPPGGVMGPEKYKTMRRRVTLHGWLPGGETVAKIDAGSSDNARTIAPIAGRIVARGAGRQRFAIDVPLPETAPAQLLVRVVHPDGSARMLPGPKIEPHRFGDGPRAGLFLAAAAAAAPLLILLPSAAAAPAAGLIAALLLAALKPFPAVAAANVPYPLPELSRLADAGREPWRVFAERRDFLHADSANLYGIDELRTGGDNLDVQPLVEFERLVRHLLVSKQPQLRDQALRLLGIANVRRLVDVPDAAPTDKALKETARGENMAVFENAYARGRASFFPQARTLPLTPEMLVDGSTRDRILSSIAAGLQGGQIDPLTTLLIHETPSVGPTVAPAPYSGGGAAVAIDEYTPQYVRLKIDVPSDGFVFLADNYYPGWTARLQGEPAPILRSWLSFRAVRVPAGKTELEFLYRPGKIRAALAALILLALSWPWFYFRPPGAPPAATKHSKKEEKEARAYEEAAMRQDGDLPADVLGAAAAWSRILTAALIGAPLLFWTTWTAFVYAGPAWAAWAARLALAGAAAAGALALYRARQAHADLA